MPCDAGIMTGQILSGISPLDVVAYQVRCFAHHWLTWTCNFMRQMMSAAFQSSHNATISLKFMMDTPNPGSSGDADVSSDAAGQPAHPAASPVDLCGFALPYLPFLHPAACQAATPAGRAVQGWVRLQRTCSALTCCYIE